ncbi:MAG TPA: hypothetical protein VH912_28955 [Streptosporangiaceae bacterium]|jgi:hypothetical protein
MAAQGQAAVVALGAGDCEAWRSGLWHQPVNTLSSLAFVVAGVWVATRPAADRADRVSGVVYAGAVVGNGIGSLLYHGPGWPGSAFVHDAAIPAAVLFIVADDAALLRGWSLRRKLAAYATALGVAGLAVAVVPGVSGAVTTASAVAAAVAEGAVVRRGHKAPTHVLLTLALAGVAGLAGRTGSPLCHPYTPLQGHAAWHVLTAVALLQWDQVRRARRRLRRPARWGGPASR